MAAKTIMKRIAIMKNIIFLTVTNFFTKTSNIENSLSSSTILS